jgi:hypothetical protein
MNFTLTVLFGFSILLPVIISLVRFSKINRAYFPFIFYIWLGLLNEITSYVLVKAGYYNTVNCNIYMLFESFLLIWQFREWKLFNANNTITYSLFSALLSIWVLENIIIYSITRYASYFLIAYSAIITIMSILLMNRFIVRERKRLLKNPVFILCVAFLIYYPFSVLSEAFWIYGFSQNAEFASQVHLISVITNFIAILLYTLAILWMPTRQKFTLPSS